MLDGLLELFGDRVLAFDTDAARHYAELAVTARAAGKGFPTTDGHIAAIATDRGFTLATRDVVPFQAAVLNVINPWEVNQLQKPGAVSARAGRAATATLDRKADDKEA